MSFFFLCVIKLKKNLLAYVEQCGGKRDEKIVYEMGIIINES